MKRKLLRKHQGFTIVELLIVVVVIGVLAAVALVAFNGIQNRARAGAAQAGAKSGSTKIQSYAVQNSDQYPGDLSSTGLDNNGATYYEYSSNNASTPKTFCLTATVSGTSYYVSHTTPTPTVGLCSGHTGVVGIADGAGIQTVTNANCPSTRTRTVDVRDNRTYWVQQMADGKCWMLTNLAYAGGGTNTNGDTKTLVNGTADSVSTYTIAKYYIPTGASPTTEPTAPSTATNGIGQYGYLYNWCAAMGVQATAACANATTPAIVATTSICPAGWRLPTGVASGEIKLLNDAVNAGSTTSDTGLRTTWLMQYGGNWYNTYASQGANANYWSASQYSAPVAYGLYAYSTNVYPAFWNFTTKDYAKSVRCVAM